MRTMKYTGIVVLATLLAVTSMADVVSTNYGDFSAASVDFLQVQEHTSNPGDTVPKYGAPLITAGSDTMDFDPVGFSAIAANGSSDITDGNLVFEVDAHNGKVIEKISFAERGTFSLGGTGTDATYVSVFADFYVEISEVNNSPIAPIGYWALMEFAPNADGKRELVTDGAGNGIWSGNVMVDLNDLLVNNGWGISDRATNIKVDLNNVLEAYSEDGTTSSIAKKDFDAALSIQIIPEPASMALIGLSSTLAIFVRRRFFIS